MTVTLRSLRSILLSVAVLLAGHGLQLTLLPLEAQTFGWSTSAIGLTGSAYYVGFILGCLSIPHLIRRVGHIRAHAVAVAVATLAVLLASMFESFFFWLGLRFLTGWSLASLYTVIESWLNEEVDDSRRGSVLAVYTMISLGAMVAGQALVEFDAFSLDELFPIAAVLIVAAAIPVSLTERSQPTVPHEVQIRWRAAFDASQVGLVCAGLSGLVAGLLWSVGVVYAAEAFADPAAGARFIAAVLIGGLVFQFPMGRLSDLLDRRWIILLLGLIGSIASGLWVSGLLSGNALYLVGFLCGGAAMPMYAISIAHANDNANGQFLQIASGMLMANAIGAVLGPIGYGVAQWLRLEDALLSIVLAAFLASVLWTLLRIRSHPVTREHFEPYQPLPKTSPEVLVMDPRGHEEEIDPNLGEALRSR
ncbi:MAG: MFS transporter [Gammaproteobacteria bacterium]|nr:MAG: MFS transporter [Gammaproteobacteria bacterium]